MKELSVLASIFKRRKEEKENRKWLWERIKRWALSHCFVVITQNGKEPCNDQGKRGEELRDPVEKKMKRGAEK